MKFARWGFAALAAVFAVPALAAGNVESGRIKANTCMGCHGIPNYNNVYPSYRVPKLGGQSPELTVQALKAYKNGERPHKTMQAQAANLSEQDMQDIAAYLAAAPQHPGSRAAGGSNSELEKAKSCAACHGANGAQPVPGIGAPVLAGQYRQLPGTLAAGIQGGHAQERRHGGAGGGPVQAGHQGTGALFQLAGIQAVYAERARRDALKEARAGVEGRLSSLLKGEAA